MRKLAALLCSAALVACEPVSAPEFDVPDPSFGKGRVVQSVTGSGSFAVVTQQGDWRTFAFTARRHADGSVAGQWERIRRQPGNASGTKSHGIVTCFTIIGNQAFLGGFATSGLFSTPPNNESAFRVVDNGQGANAPAADQMSLEWVNAPPGFAAGYCADMPTDLALNDIQAGNIQVRP